MVYVIREAFNRVKFYPCQSVGSKVACCFAVCWFLPLLIIFIIFYPEVPLWSVLLLGFWICFLIFATVACFFHGVIFDEKKGILSLRAIFWRAAKFSEIKDIRINNRPSVNPRKYCFIEVFLKNGKIIKMSGYSSCFRLKHDVEKSAKIVSEIKKRLQEKGYLKGVLEQVISYEE